MEYTDPKTRAWIGIDPGATGAYTILRENGRYDIEDWEDEFVFANTLAEWKSDYNIMIAVVEAQHSMPKQGVASVFKFGVNYGLIRGVLAAHRIITELISPQNLAARHAPQCRWAGHQNPISGFGTQAFSGHSA